MTALPAWAQAKKPLVFGASLSLTGIYADGGKYCLEGYSLAIKQINAAGGVLGRQLRSSTTTTSPTVRPASGSTNA